MILTHDDEYERMCKSLDGVKSLMASLTVLNELDNLTSMYDNHGDCTSFNSNIIMSDILRIEQLLFSDNERKYISYITLGALINSLSKKNISGNNIDDMLDSLCTYPNAKTHLISAIIDAQNSIRQEIATEIFRTSNLWI